MVLLLAALLLAGPRAFGCRPYVVLSGSMEPALRAGSVAFIRPYSKEEVPSTGDVIAFDGGGIIVTHRIHSIPEEGMYETKGDANPAADLMLCPEAAIIGKLAYSLPWAGFVLLRLKSPGVLVFMALIYIPGLLGHFGITSQNTVQKRGKSHEKEESIQQ